jgi:SAM-dependent methyltransferase
MPDLVEQIRERRVGQWALVSLAVLLAALSFPTTLQGQREGRRAEWQRAPEVMEAVGAREAAVIADVGAGQGYFTFRLVERVGETGRVFAVEIDAGDLRRLRGLLESDSLTNVEIIEGNVDDPLLPADSLDAILVVDSYHEMWAFTGMLGGFLRSLKPGGRLVLLDFQPSDPEAPRRSQTSAHTIAVELVETELREAGFEILSRDDNFTDASGDRGRRRQQWMLVARRPPITTSPDESRD